MGGHDILNPHCLNKLAGTSFVSPT